jgi:hypothetical protein
LMEFSRRTPAGVVSAGLGDVWVRVRLGLTSAAPARQAEA